MIRAPICLNQIKEKMSKGTYEGTFLFFETDVTLLVDNAKTFNKKGSNIYQNAVRIMVCFLPQARKKQTRENGPSNLTLICTFRQLSQSSKMSSRRSLTIL